MIPSGFEISNEVRQQAIENVKNIKRSLGCEIPLKIQGNEISVNAVIYTSFDKKRIELSIILEDLKAALLSNKSVPSNFRHISGIEMEYRSKRFKCVEINERKCDINCAGLQKGFFDISMIELKFNKLEKE